MAHSQHALLLILVAITSCVISQTVDYRLPNIFRPADYRVHLNLTADVFTEDSNEFTGMIIINFTSTVPATAIQLHASHEFLKIDLVTLSNTDIAESQYSINPVTDILTILLPGQISANVYYRLIIEFSGNLSTTDMSGFYKSSYVDDAGVTKYLATTQFQPTSARRAFPCFDEPSFKSTFEIYITYPHGLNALSNTPGEIFRNHDDSDTVRYNVTSVMSTYLLAFVISEFTCTQGENIGTVPYQICSREEANETREWAVEIGPKILESLNEFTQFDYSRGKEKLDQVAIPDFAAGAMENWGLVTYREMYLLWDPEESSNRYKQLIATIIAHEFAHFWFGNLVTCAWWSELFLNEGYATYFEFHAVHDVLPEWQLDKQFVVDVVQSVFVNDAFVTANALQSNVSSPTEVMGKFDRISYYKGGSVFRMVEHFMGSDNFRNGLRNYLETYQFSTAVPENLWTSLNTTINDTLTKLPTDSLEEIMENWVQSSGFPLLTVTRNGQTVTISQERFLYSGNDTTLKWYVPISYTTSEDQNKFVTTAPSVWLTPTEDVNITVPDNTRWIILNNEQTAFFRVTYDNSLWNGISTALWSDDFGGIPEINRAQVVDDLFNLARANKILYSEVFRIVEFVSKDTSYFTWVPTFAGFNFLLDRIGAGSQLGVYISNHLLELMQELYGSISFTAHDEEDQIHTLKQVLALTWACRLGNNNCITHARVYYSLYKFSGNRPHRNLRGITYCNALRYSNSSADWEFLWNAYLNTTIASEQATIISSLGCSRDEQILERYLNLSITDNSGIRPQDGVNVFTSVYTGNPSGINVAFRFLTQNHEAIVEKYQSINALPNIIAGLAGTFTTQEQIDQLQEFINTGLPEEHHTHANAAVQTAGNNLLWLQQFEEHLNDFYDPDITTLSTTTEGGAENIGAHLFFTCLAVLVGSYLN